MFWVMGMIGAFVVYHVLYAYALSARYESSFFTILKIRQNIIRDILAGQFY